MRFRDAVHVGVLAGILVASSGMKPWPHATPSHREPSAPVCEDRSNYLIQSDDSIKPNVGVGVVCENENRFYGWVESANQLDNVSAILEYESGGRDTSRKYVAGLVKQDSITKRLNLPVTVGPTQASTHFPYNYEYKIFHLFTLKTIPLDVRVSVTEKSSGTWVMTAAGYRDDKLEFTMTCPIEGLRYSCPKKK